MKNKYILLMPLLALVSACNFLGEKKEVQWSTFVKKNAFTIQFPSYLQKDSALSPEAAMAYDNKYKEFYCIVIHEPKDTFAALGYADLSLDAYVDLVKQGRDSTLNLKTLSETKTKVNGLEAIEIKMENRLQPEGSKWPVTCLMRQLLINGKDGFFQIYVWGLDKDNEKNTPDFNRIISSFREI